jgi:hypothetical protein
MLTPFTNLNAAAGASPGSRTSLSAGFLTLVLILILLSCLVPAMVSARSKLDVVTVENGDTIIGEVKKLERGQMRLSTSAASSIYIDWTYVTKLVSPYHFQVEIKSGQRHFGTLGEPSTDGVLLVLGFDAAVQVPLDSVVKITPIEDGFWKRLDGSLSVGYQFTKSSDVTTFNVLGDVNYRVRKFRIGMDFTSLLTQQASGTTDRENLTLSYTRFYKKRLFTNWDATGEKNAELGFDLRLLASGAIGRHFLQTNHQILDGSVGLSFNREFPVGSSEPEDNLEGILSLSYNLFRFRSPKVDLNTSMRVYPSITQSGRVRSEFSIKFRWELFKDFFWEMDYYDSQDSQASATGNSTSDYGIITSLGWSF